MRVWRAWVDSRRALLRGESTTEQAASAADAVLGLDRAVRAALLHEALRGRDRQAALALLPRLDAEDLEPLFGDLIYLASFSHGPIQLARDAIRLLPRGWVLAHIEQAAEPLLRRGDWDTYRRLLELYEQLDPDLTRRLAERAAVQPDPDTREAGDEFLHRIADAANSP
jgi:hypothetical protein